MVAPTPNKTAKECVSSASLVWTLIETKPLIPKLINLEFIAPKARTIGIATFFSEIFLSLKIRCLHPSLTAISASKHNCPNFFSKFVWTSNVQSRNLILLLKKLVNLSNCEFDNIGLSNT